MDGQRRSWTQIEDAELLRYREQGADFTTISAAMGRSRNSCIGRARKLWLKQVMHDLPDQVSDRNSINLNHGEPSK
jgi:hypothetical protein